MIVSFVYRIFTVLLIALACLSLQGLERDVVGFSQQFAEDHRTRLCGHFLAFEANAHAGLSYLAQRLTLEGAEEAVNSWIEEERPGIDCSATKVELFRQVNPALPRDYPNLWFRS